jgi:hypothetical protein
MGSPKVLRASGDHDFSAQAKRHALAPQVAETAVDWKIHSGNKGGFLRA